MTEPADGLEKSDKPASEVLETATDIQRVSRSTAKTEQFKEDTTIQKLLGRCAIGGMVAQLIVANLVFLKYADSKGWSKLSDGVIQVYLAATVVQIIGVVLVIARSVYPEGGRRG